MSALQQVRLQNINDNLGNKQWFLFDSLLSIPYKIMNYSQLIHMMANTWKEFFTWEKSNSPAAGDLIVIFVGLEDTWTLAGWISSRW